MTEPCPVIDSPPERRSASVTAARMAYTETGVKVLVFSLTALAFVCVCLTIGITAMYRAAMERQPYFLATDSATGQTYAIRPEALEFHATDPALQSYISDFIKEHLERIPETVQAAYTQSLFYMDQNLTTGRAVNSDLKEIAEFLAGKGDVVHITVNNVLISGADHGCRDQVGSPGCKATIQMRRTTANRINDSEIESHDALAEITFSLQRTITRAMMEHHNPIGLVIKSFREVHHD